MQTVLDTLKSKPYFYGLNYWTIIGGAGNANEQILDYTSLAPIGGYANLLKVYTGGAAFNPATHLVTNTGALIQLNNASGGSVGDTLTLLTPGSAAFRTPAASITAATNKGAVYATGATTATSTAALTDGQLLVGATAGNPAPATLTAGSNIAVTNAANAITLAVTGTVPSATTATTAGNVTGTVAVANGGTGLTAPGSTGNILTSNGTAWVSSAPAGGGGGTPRATLAFPTAGGSGNQISTAGAGTNLYGFAQGAYTHTVTGSGTSSSGGIYRRGSGWAGNAFRNMTGTFSGSIPNNAGNGTVYIRFIYTGAAGSISADDYSARQIGFVCTGGAVYAQVGNGSTGQSTVLTGVNLVGNDVTITVAVIDGVSVKFSVDGTLAATFTTGLPDTTTQRKAVLLERVDDGNGAGTSLAIYGYAISYDA